MNDLAPTSIPDDQVTLGDKRVQTANYERYKGRKGVTDRIGVISSALLRGYNYFYEGQGGQKTLFRAPTNPDTLKFVQGILGEPTQRFGLLLFHYTTDETGEVLDPEKLRGKIKTWVISESRYEELTLMNRQWPLLDAGYDGTQHDINIKCTEENFQRMTFTPCPNALWKKKQNWYDTIKAQETKAKERLRWALGRQLKDEEVMRLLGGSPNNPTAAKDATGEIDLSDIVGEDTE